ncbi:hypothetical protein NDN01_00655 [Sphingomonas sp. QA11]|uniref:hypothetical protein n=1 Tax=Sphingomonas sp. QA11 TaxID=2950605 RepID=UPI0023490350|nr:hypothetical protein [Sphingomonas sp. QA11]WCM27482.1 hypothetical protein NDN01_00655 [Sphingomonas sp. QA11]
MQALLILLAAVGLAPLVLGMARLGRPAPGTSLWPGLSSILLCVLAFNLTFFWQELWLVVPKALTPGLAPVLYHNDHSWTGDAPVAELLQGTGALATLASGLASLVILLVRPRLSATWRLFLFWMAFQGLFQSLSQFAIGTVLPGNDMGRALAFLGVSEAGKGVLLLAVTLAMGLAGTVLATLAPAGLARSEVFRTRAFGVAMLLTAIACVLLVAPYRMPRNPVEVALVPAIVNLIGIGWLVLGASFSRRRRRIDGDRKTSLAGPGIALIALLLFFQIVLRPGVAF